MGANGSLVNGAITAANNQSFSLTSTAPTRGRARCDAGRLPERQTGIGASHDLSALLNAGLGH